MATTLVLNPRHDSAFVARAEALVADDVIRTPEELEARLRPLYPNVLVRARELAGESFTVWYVYRDGHWVPAPPRDAHGG